MNVIELNRPVSYINGLRSYKIYIDGQYRSTLDSGESKSFTVTDGVHKVVAGIDWCSSREMVIDTRNQPLVNVKVDAFVFSQWLLPFLLAVVLIHGFLSSNYGFEYTIYLLLIPFLYQTYLLTLGRKHYLRLVLTPG